MDLPSHLNAKHYAICDALFYILLSLSFLSLLSACTSLSSLFFAATRDYDYCRTFRDCAEEISKPSFAPWDTDSEEFTDFICAKHRFLAARRDNTKNCEDWARKEWWMNKIRKFCIEKWWKREARKEIWIKIKESVDKRRRTRGRKDWACLFHAVRTEATSISPVRCRFLEDTSVQWLKLDTV